ncbi:MAG: TerB family tellurite resistance protein [Hyphomonadaceae bacterium]|nr:TerB family tellurite resistance protein [Hyphomonadaceae bacterium]
MSPKFLEFLLEVLVNGARIDGAADASERDEIVKIMTEVKGAPFERAQVDLRLELATLTREDLCAYLGRAGVHFSEEERKTVLRGLVRVIAADGRLDAAESAALVGYIEAIGFSHGPSALDMIMQPFRNAV